MFTVGKGDFGNAVIELHGLIPKIIDDGLPEK